MNTVTKKQSWLKTAFQRISVILGPKRKALTVAKPNIAASVAIPDEFSFEVVVDLYNEYTLNRAKTIIKKETEEEVTSDELIKKIEFANIWRKCASGNLAEETDDIASEICFSDEAKETYEQITKYAIFNLLETGNIDTKNILDVTKDMPYRWSRQTARKLFKNTSQAKIITQYYRLATPNAKKQTAETLTTDEALYG